MKQELIKPLLITLAIFAVGFLAYVFKEQTIVLIGISVCCGAFAMVYHMVDNYIKWGNVGGDPNRPFDGY